MKNTIIFTFLVFILGACNQTAGNRMAKNSPGKELFYQKCNVCHLDSRPTKEQAPYMLAPPIMGVMYHVKGGIEGKTPSEKRNKAIAFIMDYVHNPDRSKSLCEGHALDRYGVMPSLRNAVSQEEIRLIANYLYDNFPPKDLDHDELSKEMHEN